MFHLLSQLISLPVLSLLVLQSHRASTVAIVRSEDRQSTQTKPASLKANAESSSRRAASAFQVPLAIGERESVRREHEPERVATFISPAGALISQGSPEAVGAKRAATPMKVDERVQQMAKSLNYFNDTVRVDNSVSAASCNFGSLEYALFIDGKDRKNTFIETGTPGKYGYGKTFIERQEVAWSRAQSTSKERITVDYLKSLHELSSGAPYRDLGDHVMIELPCLSDADEGLKQELLKDVPLNIRAISHNKGGSIKAVLTKPFSSYEVRQHMKEIIDQYNSDQQVAQEAHQKLINLVKFLRSLAWLHPFLDGNGRLRTLILQRELRRLQLGCGAMMFNNNQDIYYTPTQIYSRKILEGMAAAEYALSHKQDPWDDAVRRGVHSYVFPVPASLARCKTNALRNNKDITLARTT